MAGDGEDGGDGVERKDDVSEFDGDEGKQEDGRGGATFFKDDEVVLARADGMKAFKQGDPARCGGGTVWGGGNEQADGGDEDDEGEFARQ